jgi:glycosyltransferase involved in cell wall biosynthesis
MRIAMLINNTCENDARVIREARALSDAGHEVYILAVWATGLAREEVRDGVTYLRFTLPWHAGQRAAARAEVSQRPAPATPAPATPAPVTPAPDATNRTIEESVRPPEQRRALAFGLWLVTRYLRAIARRSRKAVQKLARQMRNAGQKLARRMRNAGQKLARHALIKGLTPSGLALARHARIFHLALQELQPDVVHAHEMATLLGGWRYTRNHRAALVYDSHELELGRNGFFSDWEKSLRAKAEKFLIRRADAVITVCDSIADYLARHYKIPRPTVVLNSPDDHPLQASATNLRSALGLDLATPLAVYVGKVTFNRGIEFGVDALAQYPELHLALVGPRDERVTARLREQAAALQVSDRLHIVDPVPHEQVVSFIHSADVSLVLIQPVCLSYEYCFPNKLLESILGGVPVLASRLVELERLVTETGAGLVVPPDDATAITAGIRQIVANPQAMRASAATIARTREKYGWPAQATRLLALYQQLNRNHA